jgi:hypothetical protein
MRPEAVQRDFRVEEKMRIVFLTISLSFSLAFASAANASSSASSTATLIEKVQALKTQSDATMMLNEFNLLNVQSYKACYCRKLSSELSNQADLKQICGDAGSAEVRYLRKNMNWKGEISQINQSCDKIVSSYSERVNSELKQMRVTLAILNANRPLQPPQREKLGLYRDKPSSLFGTEINHRLLDAARFAPLNPLSSSELASAFQSYFERSMEACLKFVGQSARSADQAGNPVWRVPQDRLCAAILEPQENSLLLDQAANDPAFQQAFLDVQQKFLWAIYRRKNERYFPEQLSGYLDLIEKNATLLYLSGPSATDTDILRALGQISGKAAERKADGLLDASNFKQFGADGSAILKTANAAEVLESIKGSTIKLMDRAAAIPYAKLLAKKAYGWDEKKTDVVFGELAEERIHQKHHEHQVAKVWTLGTAVICALPIGRVVTVLASSMLRPGCFFATGVPFQAYFIMEFGHQYKENLAAVLSSPDGTHRVSTFIEAETALKEAMFFATLLGLEVMTFGMETVEFIEHVATRAH